MLSLLWEAQELKIIKNKRGEKLLKTKSSLDTVTLSGIQSIQCLYLRNAAFIHLTAIFKSIYCSLTVQWLIAKVDTQSKLSLKSIINIFGLKSWEQVYIFKFVFLDEALIFTYELLNYFCYSCRALSRIVDSETLLP